MPNEQKQDLSAKDASQPGAAEPASLDTAASSLTTQGLSNQDAITEKLFGTGVQDQDSLDLREENRPAEKGMLGLPDDEAYKTLFEKWK